MGIIEELSSERSINLYQWQSFAQEVARFFTETSQLRLSNSPSEIRYIVNDSAAKHSKTDGIYTYKFEDWKNSSTIHPEFKVRAVRNTQAGEESANFTIENDGETYLVYGAPGKNYAVFMTLLNDGFGGPRFRSVPYRITMDNNFVAVPQEEARLAYDRLHDFFTTFKRTLIQNIGNPLTTESGDFR